MTENDKSSGREKTLISILERLADEMQHQDAMLKDVLKRQDEFEKAFGRAESHRKSKQVDTDKSHEALLDSFHHYRSDMFKLVNEQDHINKNINDLEKLIKATVFSMETTTQKLDQLDIRMTGQENALKEHSDYLVKQAEVLRNEIAESNRKFTKLHADTEKNLSTLHHETEAHLSKFRHETAQRLLMLDSIVSSVQTLITRTDPDLKKPHLIIRFFKKVGNFFRIRLPLIIGSRRK